MTLSRLVCVITTIFSWFGIRFLRFLPRGRTTGAAPDNLPRFPWSWDFAMRTFCARPLSANDLKPFSRRGQTRIAVQHAAYVSFWHKADVAPAVSDVRFWVKSRHRYFS
jgi:hypothetical protein